MRCLVCFTSVPDDEDHCPKCGDDVRQWRDTDEVAQRLLQDGVNHATQGDLLRATVSLAGAAFLNPRDPQALKTLGQVLAQQGDYPDAAAYLQRSVDLAQREKLPEDPETSADLAKAQALLTGPGSAMVCLLCDFPREAPAGGADTPGTTDPGTPPTGEPSALDQAWRTVSAIEVGWSPRVQGMGAVLGWTTGAPEAPLDGPWLYLRGLFALGDGDRDSATELFRQSAVADASRRNAEIHLLCLAVDAGDVGPTLAFLKQQGHEGDDLAVSIATAAKIQDTRRGDPLGAMTLLTAALEVAKANKPQLAEALVETTQDLTAGEEAAATHDVLIRAVDVAPDSDVLQARLAETYLSLGKVPEGIQRLEAFIQGHSDAWQAHYALSQLYWQQQQYDQALASLEQVAKLDGPTPAERADMFYLIGKLHRHLKHDDQARQALDEALRLASDHAKARKLRDELSGPSAE